MPIEKIEQYASSLGVSDVKTIPADAIRIDEELAKICKDPGCPGYGISANCPPHVMKPEEFRKLLAKHNLALLFKFDVPQEILLGSEKKEITRLLHETAAAIEQFAISQGYVQSRGFAAGSCKPVFCESFEQCRAVSKEGTCRHPNSSRPSMSGLGVDFSALTKLVGWRMEIVGPEDRQGLKKDSLGSMIGMVLIG
jgi:predicted metal-binding protein